MTLVYQSTRDENNKVTASQAILQGLATDGGLFTPLTTPEVTLEFDRLKDASYQEVAKLVLSAFWMILLKKNWITVSQMLMTTSLIQLLLHQWSNFKTITTLSSFMVLPLLSKIWRFQYCPIC